MWDEYGVTMAHRCRGVMLTLDVDWAPDYAVDFAAAELIRRGVRATWFVTHSSAAIDRLREYPELFELGAHPNFLSNSTHGSSTAEVLTHCTGLVPGATSVRMHGLMQSTRLLNTLIETTSMGWTRRCFCPAQHG